MRTKSTVPLSRWKEPDTCARLPLTPFDLRLLAALWLEGSRTFLELWGHCFIRHGKLHRGPTFPPFRFPKGDALHRRTAGHIVKQRLAWVLIPIPGVISRLMKGFNHGGVVHVQKMQWVILVFGHQLTMACPNKQLDNRVNLCLRGGVTRRLTPIQASTIVSDINS